MNYVIGLAVSSTVAAVTSSYTVQNIINPIKNSIKEVFKDVTALNTLIYTSKIRFEKMGKTYMILKSNNNSFIQWFHTERLQNVFTYLNSIVCVTFNIIEKLEDCELHLEYEYIYALSDCLIYKKDYSTDFRHVDGNRDIIILSHLFNTLTKDDCERFILKNKYKILWDIKKALQGIFDSGYTYGKMNWEHICIHDNNFKLVVDDSLKSPSPNNIEYHNNFDNCWVNFIMLLNSVLLKPAERVSANHERQNLVELLKKINPGGCIIRTIRSIENSKIYHINTIDELKYLMNVSSEEDDSDNEIIMNML